MQKSTAYINGNIYTMESEHDKCSAVVVQGDKFIYCGEDDTAKKLANEIIDLNGAVILPGMIDTHQHLFSYASSFKQLSLDKVTSMKELKEVLSEYAKHVPEGEWIYGVGYNSDIFTDDTRLPDRYDLDEACPNHPVLLARWCLHFFSANSLALKTAGIDQNFRLAAEGNVRFDEKGEPTGIICDAAGALIASMIPDPLTTLEAKMDVLEQACHELNKLGLTGTHAIQAKICNLMEYSDAYQALNDDGRLTLRIYLGIDELPNCSIQTGLGDNMVKYGFYKLFVDGNLGGRTAYMINPYSDDCTATGMSNHTQEELTALVRDGYTRGIQVGTHVIGDQAIEMLTTAIETVYHEDPKPDPRFRMIHMTVLNENIIDRIKKLPVIIDIQPPFIHTDMPWIDERIGTERGPYTNPWRKLIDAGLTLTAGSDMPGYGPMQGIYCIVTRKDLNGYPKNGWYPENCVSVYEALCMYTKNAAYSSFEEDIKGTITKGKLADFVIIDKDIFHVSPEEIKDIQILKTYLGGKLVYSSSEAV